MSRILRKKSLTVTILNAPPGTCQYTTLRRARELYATGRAEFAGHLLIRIFSEEHQRRVMRAEHQDFAEREINRRGVIYWNGRSGAEKLHRPGEVVS